MDFNGRAEVSEWAYEAMCWMTMHGVIEGKGEDPRPEGQCHPHRGCGGIDAVL